MSFLDHLTPSDEAKMIRDSAARFTKAVSEDALRHSDGFDAQRWADMADLGWHGVLVDETEGGLGLGAAEAVILANAVGHARLPEPFVASSITALTALRTAGVGVDVLAGLAEGNRIFAPVGFGLPVGMATPVSAMATKDGAALSGTVPLCEVGPHTTDLLIFAGGPEPILVHLATAAGDIAIAQYRGIDGRHLGKVHLDGCTVGSASILARDTAARDAVAKAEAFTIAALCADAVGAIDKALALTGAYLNERQQFGRPLAGFQALRHRFADISVEAELARSMAEMASFAAQTLPDPAPLQDRARARICRAAQTVGQATIQLHGGMGMTDEMAIGHYFRRLISLQALLGQEAGSLRLRSAALAAEIDAEAKLEAAQ